MPIAILDPFSGISGDMTLGALIDVGLDPEWLMALPQRMGLEGIGVRIQDVLRGAPTEIDAICGAVVRTAQKHNISTPANWACWQLVKALARQPNG